MYCVFVSLALYSMCACCVCVSCTCKTVADVSGGGGDGMHSLYMFVHPFKISRATVSKLVVCVCPHKRTPLYRRRRYNNIK